MIVGISLFMALRGETIEQQLPLLGAIALGAYRLLQPLQQCFNSISRLAAYQASVIRIQPFLKSNYSSDFDPHSFLDQDFLPNLSKAIPIVQFQSVNFRYSGSLPLVISQLNLSISVGERIALVGTTGCGKSTCSDLMLGLLRPDSGKVLGHGVDLHSAPEILNSWQTRVAHVPQQIYLSDSSFASNIAFGIPDHLIDMARVKKASEQAQIDDLIEVHLTVIQQ